MYKEMIEQARKNGKANEQTMLKSIEHVDELLEKIKDAHPEVYWDFIYQTHKDIYGPHYNEKFADYDLKNIFYTDKAGEKHHGPHWTKDEVLSAWNGKTFPTGTTDCDKWVAANAFYADLCKALDPQQILDSAYLFWFADEDDDSKGKIWHYMHS